MENKTKKLPQVKLDELNIYLQVIYTHYGKKTNEEYAELVQENFNVSCSVEDINHIEELVHNQKLVDYERISRRESYFRYLNSFNPLDDE